MNNRHEDLIETLKQIDNCNERLAHLLIQTMSNYTKREIENAAKSLPLSVPLPADASKWEMMKHIFTHVSGDDWLLLKSK